MIPIVVISHGGIARELLATAAIILGEHKEDGPADAIEISGSASVDEVRQRISEIVKSHSSLDGYSGTLILTDMAGGSSCNVCLPLVKTHRVAIISGANLYMVLSAIKNRSTVSSLEELKKHVMSDGIKSIADVCSIFVK